MLKRRMGAEAPTAQETALSPQSAPAGGLKEGEEKAREQRITLEPVKKIGEEEVLRATEILKKYKSSKANLEARIVASEDWWRLRHWEQMKAESNARGGDGDPKPRSAWLVNTILAKHADVMDAYPEPNCLPREQSDAPQAKVLSSILPVILQQNDFEKVWADEAWYKLKTGTGVYGVYWDTNKLNGLGDISIRSLDVLNLFWEAGITDIQQSRNVFFVDLVDNEVLEERYPQLKGKLNGGKDVTISKYRYDDTVDTTDKTTVIDWYYKRRQNGRDVLHYCKYTGKEVLYATENETDPPTETIVDPITGIPRQVPTGQPMSETGLYDHGKYPFVFDAMYPVAGTPCGYGYIDICKSPQAQIDLLENAFMKNALVNATPRYWVREDSGVNEDEFIDFTKPMIHIQSLSEETVKLMETPVIQGNTLNLLTSIVDQMKETSGNRDVANGGTQAGVTAASAIAAMQEQAGKLSRDINKNAYRAFREVCEFCVELIRQFYDAPRSFRITGDLGAYQYITFDNAGLQPQPMGMLGGVDMGYRLPVFDLEINAQKEAAYSKMAYNELGIQLYQLGFWNPQMADQVLGALEVMDFKGKEKVQQRVAMNQTLQQQLTLYQQMALGLAAKYEPAMAEGLASQITGRAGIPQGGATQGLENQNVDSTGTVMPEEHPYVEKARQQAEEATQVR